MNPVPPLPENHALLGAGNSFTMPGGNDCQMRMTYGNGDHWFSFTALYSGNTPREYYCAAVDSEVVAANRELVERLNPGMVFPWSTAATEIPAPLETPPYPPLPEGFAYLGMGRTFVAQPRFEGWMTNRGNDQWVAGNNMAGDGRDRHYAALVTSEIVAANRELVERLNPGMRFPWMDVATPAAEPPPAPPMETPPPYPPLPEGHVLLGLAGDFQIPNGREFAGAFFKVLYPRNGWIAGNGIGGRSENVWYCAPAGSEIVRLNSREAPEAPVAPARVFRGYSRELAGNLYRPQDFDGRAVNRLPTRHILLGWLDELVFDGDPEASYCCTWMAMSSWGTRHSAISGVGENRPEKILVCALPDSAIALRNPEAVAFYNPGLAPVAPPPPAAPVRTFPPLEFIPPPPEDRYAGWLILGHADTIVRVSRGNSAGIWITASESQWSFSETLSTEYHPEIQAFAPDSPEVALNLEAARFYNPGAVLPGDGVASTQAREFTPITLTRDQSSRMQADGVVLIGWVTELVGESHPGDLYTAPTGGFVGYSGYTFPSRSSGYVAGPLSGALAQVNLDSVYFHNPHLRPAIISPVMTEPQPPAVKLFHLSFNGAPVSSREEFIQTITPLVSRAEVLDELAGIIWGALSYTDPESRIDAWTEREPVVLAGIDFHRIVVSDEPVEVLAVASSERSISEIITRAAAGVLLRGGLVNHFQYLESGELVVNPENPPSLEQGYEIIRRTLEIKETSQKLDNYSAWTLGMLGDQMERLFGDAFDVSMVLAQTTRAYNTYITSLGVFRACWATHRANLSYTHHKEAYYAKVEEPQKEFILDTSAALGLTVADQRKLTSYVRHYGSEGLEEAMPETTAELMERCEVRAVNKNYMFFLRSQNKWFNYRGPFENIPNGADPILNADTRAKLSREGIPEAMDVWVPVGVEVPARRGHSATIEANRVAAVDSDGEVERSHGGGLGQSPGTGDFTMARDPSAAVVATESPWTEEVETDDPEVGDNVEPGELASTQGDRLDELIEGARMAVQNLIDLSGPVPPPDTPPVRIRRRRITSPMADPFTAAIAEIEPEPPF